MSRAGRRGPPLLAQPLLAIYRRRRHRPAFFHLVLLSITVCVSAWLIYVGQGEDAPTANTSGTHIHRPSIVEQAWLVHESISPSMPHPSPCLLYITLLYPGISPLFTPYSPTVNITNYHHHLLSPTITTPYYHLSLLRPRRPRSQPARPVRLRKIALPPSRCVRQANRNASHALRGPLKQVFSLT